MTVIGPRINLVLEESETRVRKPVTFPFSTFMSIFVTSAKSRAAKEIGLTVSLQLLARADEVIE